MPLMSDKHYAITRIKSARNTWYWSVSLGRRGVLVHKTFPDLKHGGSEAALTAALAWRDEVARGDVLTFREFHEQLRSNNTSGVPGVHLAKSAAQPEGQWQAKIRLHDGRKIIKGFSVKKYGDKGAFKRAVAARKAMLDALEDRPYLVNPTAKRLRLKD